MSDLPLLGFVTLFQFLYLQNVNNIHSGYNSKAILYIKDIVHSRHSTNFSSHTTLFHYAFGQTEESQIMESEAHF